MSTCLTLDTIAIDPTDCESIYDAYYTVGVIDGSTTVVYADIQTSASEGYAPLTIDFDGSDSESYGGTITDYVWDFDTAVDSDGDGDSTNDSDNTGPTASNTYTDETTTHARLTITDDTSNSTYTSADIAVLNPIEATFTASTTATTTTTAITFDASGSTDHTGTITDYSWDFGDGSTDTGDTVSYTYSNPGTYTVTVTVTDSNGYTNTATEDILVYATGSISTDTTWSAEYSPYVISGSTSIASGYTLTIEPGVVVKFYSTSGTLSVGGTLDAQGTSAAPIAFTSYYDDDSGGDTNGDDDATSAAAGD